MKRKVNIILVLLMMVVLLGCSKKPDQLKYLAGNTNIITLIQEDTNEEITMIRGNQVFQPRKQRNVPEDQIRVYIVDENNEKIYYLVNKEQVVDQHNEVCLEKTVKANMLVNLREDKLGNLSNVVALKDEELEVDHINYEEDFKTDGNVAGYYVRKDDEVYYLPDTFLKEETMDKDQIYYETLFDRYYGEGYSKKTYIDDMTYLTLDKPDFESNPLNKNAHAVHVSMDTFFNEEANILELCANTPIDTVVIEMKNDDGRLIFESENIKAYLDEVHQANAFRVAMSKEAFQTRIQTMKDQGIYVVGRMVTFKDPNFVDQYPEAAITNSDGSLFYRDGLPWPSAFSRTCWQYMVSYATEAASLGINEIQFDYVRFPDGTGGKNLDLKNTYNESKIQGIQGFLYYAREQLHALNTYLAADVFGWNMICGDDEDIGQFIPAIATVVDVICPMSYPDHFHSGALGIQLPWQQPSLLQRVFTTKSMEVLSSIEKPAIYRCWIQGYAVMNYRITNEPGNMPRLYNAEDMINQIEGIREGGGSGYLVWNMGGYTNWINRRAGFIE